MRFVLTLWTDSADVAAAADRAGIDRIGIDLERIGKAERQQGRGTWISPHSCSSLPGLRVVLKQAALFARVDPVNRGGADQVDELIDHGVKVLMLPMFSTADEVACFVDAVAGRARTVPLVETRAACENVDEVLDIGGIDEIHIGLNDLALSLGGRRSRFEVLSSPEVERVAASVAARGARLGIGGVGRFDDADQPIAPDLLYAEYVRLGATASLISRAFLRQAPLDHHRLGVDIAKTRARLEYWRTAPNEARRQARDALHRALESRDGW